MTLFGKQFQYAVHITLGETLAEVFDPSRELSSWRVQRCFNSDVHGASPILLFLYNLPLSKARATFAKAPLQSGCCGVAQAWIRRSVTILKMVDDRVSLGAKSAGCDLFI